CSEVYTQELTQYGMHRFYIIGRLDNLDQNVVFASFLYSNDTTEVDIEFAKWGWNNPYNSWYVIQPGSHLGNVESFVTQLTGTYTTHYINWLPNLIKFKSIHGHYHEPPNPNFLIHEWLYTGNDIPLKEENLRIHINFWLYEGKPPSNSEEVEVIVKDADLPPPIGIENESHIEDLKFYLQQNSPNPIFSRTVIKYALPTKTRVELKVYDASGREITILVDKEQPTGYYKVSWDIKDISKRQLPNGIYFYRLKAGKFSETKKMVVVR
ncbi:T9SS type A sorting domain-containing protein, partial [candidate division WOR-3 bacterium]|nr:T9SS type A sorting domain-containing protein [candidate division WOR-3 bacterium]